MKLLLKNTYNGLTPLYPDDYDNKKKLKLDKVYKADIKLSRNYEFLCKYHKLIGVSWDLLGEKAQIFFKTKESFRKTIEVSAGYSDVMYNIKLKEWVEVPKSIGFDSCTEEEFQEVYERVKDVIWGLLEERNIITVDNFNNILNGF